MKIRPDDNNIFGSGSNEPLSNDEPENPSIEKKILPKFSDLPKSTSLSDRIISGVKNNSGDIPSACPKT